MAWVARRTRNTRRTRRRGFRRTASLISLIFGSQETSHPRRRPPCIWSDLICFFFFRRGGHNVGSGKNQEILELLPQELRRQNYYIGKRKPLLTLYINNVVTYYQESRPKSLHTDFVPRPTQWWQSAIDLPILPRR